MKLNIRTLAVVAITTLNSLPVMAAGTESLDTIIVSATRTATSQVSTPSSITVITRQQIENSGAASLVEVLRNQGAVQISDFYGDGRRAQVSIRGFGANAGANTLVLVDGRRLNNPDLAPPPLNTIPLEDIERIEIIQGSAGTLFGDQAVGGVINIITRSPEKLALRGKATFATHDSEDYFVSASKRFDNGVFFRLSGSDRRGDNYRDNNEFQEDNIFARAGFEHRSGKVFIERQEFDEDINLPGGLFAESFRRDRRQAQFLNDFSETRTNTSRLVLQQALSDNWQVEAEFTQRDNDIDGILTDTRFTQQRVVKEVTPRLIGSFPNRYGDVLLTFGADYQSSDYELTSQFFFGPANTRNHQQQSAVYLQVVAPVSERLTLTAGARSADVRNDLVDSFSFPAGTVIEDDATSLELGASFQLNRNWRLYTRWDENFRFAKVDEYTFTATPEPIRTQRGDSYEFGVEWQHQRSRAKAVVYRLDLDNEIDFDPTVAFGGNRNLERTRRTGLILEAATTLLKRLDLAAQYSYVDAEFKGGINSGNRIPLVAENTANINATYRFNNAWSLYAEALYIDDRVIAGDYRNEFDDLDGYSVFNMNAQYRYKNLTARFRINNLTDRKYSDYAAVGFNPANNFNPERALYAAPERTYALTLEYAFNEK